MRYVAIAVVASGCFAYSRGSFVDYETFPGKRVALGGCLDLSVAMVEDNLATGRDGRSLIADNDSTWMVYLGFHVRPMDGMR
jgi:hypothetical protein